MNDRIMKMIMVGLVLSFVAGPAQAANPYWDKVKLKCGNDGNGLVKARLRKAGLGKFLKTCQGRGGYSPPDLNKYGISTNDPDRCKRVGTSVYGYWDVEDHAACANAGNRVFWDNAKLKCKNNGDGVVKAKLKGVKLGKKRKVCEDSPPEFNALGASGEPARCKGKVDTSMWGEWDVEDHPGCEAKAADGAYWDKAVHSCRGPNTGRVKARLRGVAWGQKKSTCEQTDISVLGDTLGASGTPDKCKSYVNGSVYGFWEIENDQRCAPAWGKVRKKGCMSPDPNNPGGGNRQVYKAAFKKLKNTRGENDTEASRRAVCMDTQGPYHPDGSGPLSKPDWCKIKGLEKTAYWYVEGESCEKDLEWKKWKDDGCVKNLAPRKRAQLSVDFESKRQIRATLKNKGGPLNAACLGMPVKGKEFAGLELNFEHPTVCFSKDGDKVVAGTATVGLAGVAFMLNPVAGAAVGVVGGLGSLFLDSWDPLTSSKAIFWVDDASCGAIPQYARVQQGDDHVVLATGEISPNLAPWGEGTSPAQAPDQPPAFAPATTNMSWGSWEEGSCKDGSRIWSADLRNVPGDMNWTDACGAAIQLPYRLGNYPQALQNRLNSGDPDTGYPDRCRLAGKTVRGQFNIADPTCH